MTRMCDLPPELVGMIFTKIPITSIRSVRSTCRYWKSLTKDWVLGKGEAREQFLGFMTMDSKVCSLRFHLRRKNNCEEDGDSLDLSIKQVDVLNQVDISKVFYCDGLVLCVAKDNSRLMVWNPYLGQTRWIEPRTEFHTLYTYALGYDINRNYKILKFIDSEGFEKKDFFGYEIYDFNSNSWRVLDVTSSCKVRRLPRGVAVSDIKDFLLCFDFTKERFGPRLPLPFHSKIGEYVALSCVKEEQLAVLYQRMKHNCPPTLYIWVTTRIEPNTLSWSKFLRVEMRPFELSGSFGVNAESFFVDEEEKVVVVFDCDLYLRTKTIRYHKSFIMGEGGYFKSVNLGEAPYIEETCPKLGYTNQIYRPPLVCSSSYFPSLVQLNQSRKRKEGDNN
ncbi:hypothetical protein CARUB_v10018913mg [Capsella rubella]|uniref:F-box domain-containing protein n=1 Tax=Capsella rubella TaxID=81985 RepID=R0HNS3_9BRAS|nr:hypothetical protein CARUB_v10018913mg [Capsella rubella]